MTDTVRRFPVIVGSGRHAATLPPDRTAESAPGQPDYVAIQGSAEFSDIRRTLRSFVLPASVGFFCWYVAFVLMADYAHDFMSRRIHGLINVGLVFGFLQFVTTVGITMAYVRFAARNVDPKVDELRRAQGLDGRGEA